MNFKSHFFILFLYVGLVLDEHIAHLHPLLQVLANYNIRLEPKKMFIGFPTVTLLGQRVDSE